MGNFSYAAHTTPCVTFVKVIIAFYLAVLWDFRGLRAKKFGIANFAENHRQDEWNFGRSVPRRSLASFHFRGRPGEPIRASCAMQGT
jgi:hypothetical protein